MTDHNRRGSDMEVAKLEVKVNHLENDMNEVKTDVKSILAVLNQTKGGWKVIVLVASVAGTAGAIAAKLFPFLGGLPK